ncbi:hypothetical protein [Rhizobium leucaenae]|uniref:hypothetical protein n=1 Tax=Rhizobium leucaenae TaxID=29450 RepID=UPI00041F75BC|nr:hypothetical protein [Rhizobium leucaenae]
MDERRLTPEHKVKYLVLAEHAAFNDADIFDYSTVSGDDIDEAYEQLLDSGEQWDAESNVRGGEVETNLRCPISRNYEAKAVAAKLPDGSWVGWTYWYGGGKHGNPEEIEWIDGSYDVSCTEEEKVVTVRTFAVVEVAA